MKNIWVVEDEDNIRELVIYALESSGFKARGFGDGAEMFASLRDSLPDLILLDIMLPGDDGIGILKRLKAAEQTKRLPVIMLTAKGAEHDRVKGLDIGADDYITKPFSVMEVLSRVRAVLRRSAPESKNRTELCVGGIVLHADKRSVIVDKAPLTLTYKEFELLHYLMLNEGIVLSRDKILSQIWGYDYVGESRTVDMHIKSLRQKLGVCGGVIKTVRNVGYKAEGCVF